MFSRYSRERPRAASAGTDSVLAKYESTDVKMFMSVDEATVLAEELARRLGTNNPRPDLVVGIADGALLIARVVADRLGVPMQVLRIRRRGTGIKKTLATLPWLRSAIGKVYGLLYSLPAVRPLMMAIMNRFQKLEEPAHAELPEVRGKHVALIDDCIESGQTFLAASRMLSGARSVRSACISWSRGSQGRHVAPDIFINRRIQHFPWSTNSPHWDEYHATLARLGIRVED
jgi:adenine/guanine phosphoribosyltransferase-like PRPP-binding protein